MKWQLIKLPFEAEENDVYGRIPGSPLWPGRFTEERIKELKESDPVVWQSLFQQRPQQHGDSWFQKEWLVGQYYKKLDTNLLNRYMVIDPALSKESHGNYTVIYVFGVGEDHNHYWLHMYRDRVDPGERADAIFRLVRRFRPIRVGYEEYGIQADIFHLEEKMERENYRFKITPLGKSGGKLSKPDRIRQLVPLYRTGKIYLPETNIITTIDGTQIDMVKVFIETEYSRYKSSTYDDCLDAQARSLDPLMDIQYPKPRTETEEIYSYPVGSTWMSR